MVKNDVRKIWIDIDADGRRAFTLRLARDGTLARRGGIVGASHGAGAVGRTSGVEFRQLLDWVDEGVLAHEGLFDAPGQQGPPMRSCVAFVGETSRRVFEFRYGLDDDANPLSLQAYFDDLIRKAVDLTDAWYAAALARPRAGPPPAPPPSPDEAAADPAPPTKPWWRFW